MALTFFTRCEGLTLDGTHDFTAGTDTFLTVSGASIDPTAALIGSNGILVNAASDVLTLDAEDAVLNSAAGAIGFYFRVQTFATAAIVMRLRTNSGATNDYIQVSMNNTTNNHLRFSVRNSAEGQTLLESAFAIVNDTTYFVIFKWDTAASDRRAEIYDSGGTLLDATEDLATSLFIPIEAYPITDGMIFGEFGGTATAFYLDNIFIGTAYADGDAFYTNRNITSYTQYGAGAAIAPALQSVSNPLRW